MSAQKLILASASPRRSELLKQLAMPFKSIPSQVEEVHNEQLTAAEIAQVNAYRKARAISKKYPDELILGVDTVVALGARVYGKPRDMEEAQRFLHELQGKTHEVVTGVCLIHLRSHQQTIFCDRTFVTFKRLTIAQICDYLKRINPLDKAGGYAIQDHGHEIIESITGSYTNVVGLPLEKLRHSMEQLSLALAGH
jgi:septum formation protein